MPGEERTTVLPPVRLPSDDELAREALAAPLLSRAVELARWSAPGTPVGPDGELPRERLEAAVSRLGLGAAADGPAQAAEAWAFAVDAGLVAIADADAAPGETLAKVTEGAPAEVLETWAQGVDAVLADAAFPGLDEWLDGPFEELGVAEPSGDLAGGPDADPELDGPGDLGWQRGGEEAEEDAGLLDAALGTLYLLATSDEEVAAGASVPLPMVAAAVVLPEDEDEAASEDALDDVTAAVMRLDEQFRALSGTGLVEYEPAELTADEWQGPDVSSVPNPDLDLDPDLESLGRVRLTPLGLYGVRRRMLEAGLQAPLVGDLRHAGARELLEAVPFRPDRAAREEAELWLAEREPLEAARELLAVAHGGDPEAPGRRLGCQLVLSLLDERSEPALREALDDPELGGLARVWLAERDAADVPLPTEEMIFWLTIDTFAAQLGVTEEDAADVADDEGLRELVRDLTTQHSGFFDRAWRSDHPATADVLEAMGRLHPDRQLAKQARKAAFKARSRQEA